jgi:hypothetical protein
MTYDLPVSALSFESFIAHEVISFIPDIFKKYTGLLREGACGLSTTAELDIPENSFCYPAWSDYCAENSSDAKCKDKNLMQYISESATAKTYGSFNKSKFEGNLDLMCKGADGKVDISKCSYMCPHGGTGDAAIDKWCKVGYENYCTTGYNMFSSGLCRDYIVLHQDESTSDMSRIINYLKEIVKKHIESHKIGTQYDFDKINKLMTMSVYDFFKNEVKLDETQLAKIEKSSDLIVKQYFGCVLSSDYYEKEAIYKLSKNGINATTFSKPHCFSTICNSTDSIRDATMKQSDCPSCYSAMNLHIENGTGNNIDASQNSECFTDNSTTGDGVDNSGSGDSGSGDSGSGDSGSSGSGSGLGDSGSSGLGDSGSSDLGDSGSSGLGDSGSSGSGSGDSGSSSSSGSSDSSSSDSSSDSTLTDTIAESVLGSSKTKTNTNYLIIFLAIAAILFIMMMARKRR